MASSARRDPVRELTLLVRAPEPGTSNLGEFLANNASGLAQVLGLVADDFEAARVLDDEDLAPRIRQLLERDRDSRVQQDLERRRERSLEAARRLGATARWTDLGAELDVDLLLGELLADRTRKWVALEAPEVWKIIIPRHLVAAAAPLRRAHIDLASWVDDKGLHLRWKGGRGGYNWYPRRVDARFADQVLTVPFVRKVAQRPPRRRAGAWVGHILQELGYIT